MLLKATRRLDCQDKTQAVSYLTYESCTVLLWRAAACVQAGAGLVADSVPESEYEETVNKAAALGRAIDLAEQAFVDC